MTANLGPGRPSLTLLTDDQTWEVQHLPAGRSATSDSWQGVSTGVAFSGEHSVFVSEGNSGRVARIDLGIGEPGRTIDLNQGGYQDSFTGDLVLDSSRGILYVADQANFRVAVIDTHSHRILSSIETGPLPFALALSPNGEKLYVTNVGVFEYRAVPGGLGFPAFGFPSAAAREGTQESAAGGVPGLGDPRAGRGDSLTIVDVTKPSMPKVEAVVRTGAQGWGSSPSGIAATAQAVFVSNAGSDSITVIDAATNRIEREIPLRIPGLEQYRGIVPAGLAYDEARGWLLAAEAGINAVAVIEVHSGKLLGHIPVGWFPTRVLVNDDTVYVANAQGLGTGPSATREGGTRYQVEEARSGSVSIFHMPNAGDLAEATAVVMRACGFEPRAAERRPLPAGIRHVVLIVKSGRSFDEVMGDMERAANGPVMGDPALARFGEHGYVDGERKRLSLRDADVTPNHHAIARRWSFSDNFYADSEMGAEGRHWLAEAYPNLWTESSFLAAFGSGKDFRLSGAKGRLSFAGKSGSVQPEDETESGTLWSYLARQGVSFYNFGEGLDLAGAEREQTAPAGAVYRTNMPMPEALYTSTSRAYPGVNFAIADTERAERLIREIGERFAAPGRDLPRFIYILLPNDGASGPRGPRYPYEASYVADNDAALGRIVEYLSSTRWWSQMAIFVTEDAAGEVDHLDGHRTLLLCAGPWARRGYVSHINSSFPALIKTIFRLLGIPPLNLFDASAADLDDCFASSPDPAPYHALSVDRRVYDAGAR